MEVKELFSETQKTVEALRSEVEELKGKSADYVVTDKLGKIEADLAANLEAEQKAMADRLDRIETQANRPGGVSAQDEAKAVQHEKLFGAFLRKGSEPDELKAMATSAQADGGFLVPDRMRAGIQKRHRRTSPVRMVATVESFSGGTYDVLMDRDDAGYEWAGEKSSRSETATPTLARVSIPLHELSALPKVSQRMLDVADFDVEAWLIDKVSDRFGRAEATAFVSGDGVNKPKGFLAYAASDAADADRASETLQYRVSGEAGGFASAKPADVLVETFYDLQGVYQENASWMMKNTTAAKVAVLTDGDGQYLLQSMLNTDGQLVRVIQGRPLYLADDMPKIAANSLAIAVGDFSAYTIVDNANVTVLRDPYSSKPNVLFYSTKRVGGGLTDFDAIKLIKFAAS
jgi:HK97 family phage major capsid protein